jgi:hypothetical protein
VKSAKVSLLYYLHKCSINLLRYIMLGYPSPLTDKSVLARAVQDLQDLQNHHVVESFDLSNLTISEEMEIFLEDRFLKLAGVPLM